MMKHILVVFLAIIFSGCGKHDALDGVNIDGIAPTVVAVTPSKGDMDEASNTPVQIQFSEKISNASIALISSVGEEVQGNITTDNNNAVTFYPTNPSGLTPNVTYIGRVTGVTDLAGNKMEGVYSWSFRTADTPAGPMRVTTVDPAPFAVVLPVNSTISIFFSELASPASLENSITLTGPEGPVAGNILYSASQRAVYFTTYFSLRPGATYTATVKGVKDEAGNMIADCSWFFTTAWR